MYGGAYSHHRFYGDYNACVVNPYNQWPNQYSWPLCVLKPGSGSVEQISEGWR